MFSTAYYNIYLTIEHGRIPKDATMPVSLISSEFDPAIWICQRNTGERLGRSLITLARLYSGLLLVDGSVLLEHRADLGVELVQLTDVHPTLLSTKRAQGTPT